jgi:hypothetical protein
MKSTMRLIVGAPYVSACPVHTDFLAKLLNNRFLLWKLCRQKSEELNKIVIEEKMIIRSIFLFFIDSPE